MQITQADINLFMTDSAEVPAQYQSQARKCVTFGKSQLHPDGPDNTGLRVHMSGSQLYQLGCEIVEHFARTEPKALESMLERAREAA